MTFMQNAPLVLLGIPLGVHANLRMPGGAWSEVVASPAFHQRHHARDAATMNFASLFPWLDRIFGTHSAEHASVFGVSAQAHSIGAAKNSSTSLRRAIVSA